MKKIILLILFGFQFPFLSNAQTYFPFPDSNAMWSYVTCFNVNPNPPPFIINCNTYYYLIGGDSTYNGQTYHTVNYYYDSTLSSPILSGLLRQDTASRKVYFFSNGAPNEQLLYNFAANIGDTISEISGLVVTMIDSILVGSTYRRRFCTNYDCVIEGIGSLQELFYKGSLEATFNLSCFTQNGNLLYMDTMYNSCNVMIIGIEEKLPNPFKLQVFPNPVIRCSQLIIDPLKNDVLISVFDYTGRELYTVLKDNTSDLTIW